MMTPSEKYPIKNHEGRACAINLTHMPTTGIRPWMHDEVMQALSAQLGGYWTCVKLSGIWHIYHNNHLLTGDALTGRQYRSFDRALQAATEKVLPRALAIVRDVEFPS